MTAALLFPQDRVDVFSRMTTGYSGDEQRVYDRYVRSGVPSGYSTQLSQVPVHSLDFLDFSAQSQEAAQRPAPQQAAGAASALPDWRRESHGHLRSVSGSNDGVDEFEDVNDDGTEVNALQRWTSASSADMSSIKRKMKRFRLTHNQTRFLMNEFHREPHPDAAHREYLSRKIPGLSARQVQVWFQNRRAKSKRVTSDSEGPVASKTIDHASDRSQSPQPKPAIVRYPMATTSTAQGLPPLQAFEPTRQVSTAELFARSLSEQASSADHVARSTTSVGSSLAPAPPQHAKSRRKRPTTTLIFGREYTVWVDDSDCDSDDDGDGSSDEENAQLSPEYYAQHVTAHGHADMPLHSPAIDLNYFDLNPWSRPPLQTQGITDVATTHGASMPGAAQPSSEPITVAHTVWSPDSAPPSVGNAWYNSHRAAYGREQS